jgi:hypothetical protein
VNGVSSSDFLNIQFLIFLENNDYLSQMMVAFWKLKIFLKELYKNPEKADLNLGILVIIQ